MSTTLWTKGPGKVPLYSDWRVAFTKTSCFGGKDQDAGSVSTQSLSSDDSVSVEDNKCEEQEDTFFSVHRNMIGPKSAFFTKSFLGGDSDSSIIALPSDLPAHTFASIVEAFELILDHCYNGMNENYVPGEKFTTENSVAMLCLCNHFEMKSEICDTVIGFIQSDLTLETVGKYYKIIKDMRSELGEPSILDTKKVMEMIVAMCHENPTVLCGETELSKIADMTLWLSIGSKLANDDNKDEPETTAQASKAWSENFTSFFDTYDEEDVLDMKEFFRTMTAETILPEVSEKIALKLLEHEHKHGLSGLTSEVQKTKEMDDDDGLSRATSDVSDSTISTAAGDSDSEAEAPSEKTPLTSLQMRCIMALDESNWAGVENDVNQKRGKLVEITTPSVLEALLINSVSGERALGSKMRKLKNDLESEKKGLEEEKESYQYNQTKTKAEIIIVKKDQKLLQKILEDVSRDCETAQNKLKKLEAKASKEKTELSKTNARLEAELEKEKKKSHGLSLRYKAIEVAQNKVEIDKEMFKMTIKETIKQLDAITEIEQVYGPCGLGHLIMLLSAMNDKQECDQIKFMLKQVMADPQSFERDYGMKSATTEDCKSSDVDDCSTDESRFLADFESSAV